MYLWNKYILPFGIKSVVNMNPEDSWLSRNSEIIIKAFKGFFLSSYILFLFTMIYAIIVTILNE